MSTRSQFPITKRYVDSPTLRRKDYVVWARRLADFGIRDNSSASMACIAQASPAREDSASHPRGTG